MMSYERGYFVQLYIMISFKHLDGGGFLLSVIRIVLINYSRTLQDNLLVGFREISDLFSIFAV